VWPKRLILLPALALLLFLGMYSWNQNTGILDSLADSTGLEAIGVVLRSTDLVRTTIADTWYRYLDLVNVREENDQLRQRLTDMQNRLILAAEERAELKRLRAMLTLEPPEKWPVTAARVIGGRMGSNSVMNTITVARGYMTGAIPDTPVATEIGAVGRVLRAGPTVSTVLLINDPGSKIAVIGQDSRTQGLLVGSGAGNPLELLFTPHNNELRLREILVTSGLDGIYPKGIPVAVITSMAPADVTPFPRIRAMPLVDMARLEEVLLLERPAGLESEVPATGTFMGPLPDALIRKGRGELPP
jgi:rod shape-determining protein MreC